MAGQASRENGKLGGRPPGSKSKDTLLKEAALREYRKKVIRVADQLFTSQLHLATGLSYLYKIEKELQIGPKGGKKYVKSKPKLVTDPWEIEGYLRGKFVDGDLDDPDDPNATYYFITTEKPCTRTIDSMMDRTFGRAPQQVDLSTLGESLNQPLDDETIDRVVAAYTARKQRPISAKRKQRPASKDTGEQRPS